MPRYDYRCKDCDHEVEVVQAFTDDPLTECPSCGGALRKKFGAVGISFKGSGFYKTDSRSTTSAGTPSNTAPSTTSSTTDSTSGDTSSSTPSTSTAATPAAPAASTPPAAATTPSSSSD